MKGFYIISIAVFGFGFAVFWVSGLVYWVRVLILKRRLKKRLEEIEPDKSYIFGYKDISKMLERQGDVIEKNWIFSGFKAVFKSGDFAIKEIEKVLYQWMDIDAIKNIKDKEVETLFRKVALTMLYFNRIMLFGMLSGFMTFIFSFLVK